MRTVASVPVPTTAPVRFDLQGTFDVGGIIFYNASPNTLTVATLDGRQVTCPANSWVKIVPSATHIFDGALLVTAQTQIASTAQSAVMWADVYMPGETMPAGDSGPLPNQMTAGNQQPRMVSVATEADWHAAGVAANVSTVTPTATVGISGFFGMVLDVNNNPLAEGFRLYQYDLSFNSLNAPATEQTIVTVLLQVVAYQGNQTTQVGSPFVVRNLSFAWVGVGPGNPYAPPYRNPIVVSITPAFPAVFWRFEMTAGLALGTAGHTVACRFNGEFDQTRSTNQNVFAVLGGQSAAPFLTQQYTGTVF